MFFGWFWAIGTRLHTKLPETANISLKRFKLFLLIPIVSIFFMSIFMSVSALSLMESNEPPNLAIFGMMGIIFPLHLLSMFGIFHSLWFNAKVIKSIELHRTETFGEFAGEFILIWFFPIGIWFIKPKVNKMMEE